VCKHRCNRELNVTKLPATSHRRSQTLSQTLRRRGHRPTTASRCSRVGRVDLPRQHADQHRHDRIPNVSKLPGSHTLEVCARQPAQPHHRFRMVENLTIDRLRQDACRRRCVNGYQRSANSLRRRASALPHSRGLCMPASAAPSPFLDGRKSDHRPPARRNLCPSVGVTGYRSRQTARAVASSLSRTLARWCVAAGAIPSPFLHGRKSVLSYQQHQLCASVRVCLDTEGRQTAPRRRAITLSRMTPVRRSGSPHPGLTFPPRVGRHVHLRHDTWSGRGTQG